jgi:class 3 adenylate cyclase/tetratricopeptide (TPR) repeat protein
MRQERKVVTVLFCDLVGFTSRAEAMDPEDVAAMLAPYQSRLKHELERYGGTVEKFIGDAVMALFGAPTAHEDDPERAVRAALAIREFAEEEGIQLRVGVTTGEALVAVDAKPEQGETMATGDVINTAARLQTAAPVNGILVGETTYRATERAIDYETVDAVEAKGKTELVPAWLAVAPRARFGVDVFQAGRAPLVGREQERELLVAALARARMERQPQLVTLVGVPGVGKSRLLYELSRVADDDPDLITWRQGRSLPYGEGLAFWALGEIVKAQAGILESASADEAAEKLAAMVQDLVAESDVEWVEQSLRPLVGLGGAGEQGLERQAMTYAAWRRFFEALAERSPTVIVFEDLHWADDGLLDFVDELVARVTGVPLLVVCNARPELLERRPGWGGGKRNAHTISLTRLSDDDTARLVAALLDRPVLSADEQALLLQRAEGNPLFAEEYARMLADGGMRTGDVPDTLQGVVAARIDALPADEKEVLQRAAVLGKVFWTDALAALTRKDEWELEETLYALERKEFVRREHRSAVAGARQYVFVHVLVRDGAYGQMPRAVRSEAHLRVADWIDTLSPDRAEDRAEMLAHHLVQAVEYGQAATIDVSAVVPRAARALREAGDRSWSLGAPGAALELYERARSLDPTEGDDPYLLLRYGRALANVRNQGEDVLARAAAALAESDPATASEAELIRGEIVWQRGSDRDRAFTFFERAAANVQGLPPSQQKMFVESQVARFLIIAGRNHEGLELVERAIEMAEQLGETEWLPDALNTRGIGRANLGDPRWREDLEKSLVLALELKSWRAGRSYINLADALLNSEGEIAGAEKYMREGLEFAEARGVDLAVRWSRGNLADALFHLGRWDEALAFADVELANSESHYLQPLSRRIRSYIRLARGDDQGARGDSDAGTTQSQAIRDPQDLIPALVSRAFCLGRLGDTVGANAALEELSATQNETEQPGVYGPSTVLLAEVVVELGRERDFDRLQRTDLATRWHKAARAIVDGERTHAADLLEAMGAKTLEADVRLQAARALREDGRGHEAAAQLADALAFYREVGASAAIREGEELLAAAS